MGLAALRYVGSSQPRDGTCVSGIGRQILTHWATKEVPRTFSYLICEVYFLNLKAF